jgi:diguanylate cyclase (GGDEF)-like protein
MSNAAARYNRQKEGRRTGAAFWRLMHEIALSAGATHVAFIALFYGLGATTLAFINVGSVLLFVLSYLCLKQRRNMLATGLILTEVMLHAVLAVRAIGWDSGFHYYLLVVVPIITISRIKTPYFRPLSLTGLLLLYLGMDYWLRELPPLDQLSHEVLTATRYFNIAGTFLLIAHFARTYLVLVQKAEREMRTLATTDPLTQLLNRRSLLEVAEYELLQRKRDNSPLAFVLTDIDHFKTINDRYGHAAGDAVLTAVSKVLREAVREQDSVARWGGEEFLILMPGANLETAGTVAERLRQQVAAIEVPFGDHRIHVSMTFGVSCHHGEESLDAPVQRADAALYKGKLTGRNQVVAEVA